MLPSIPWIFVSIFIETQLTIQFYSGIHEICRAYQGFVSDDGIRMFSSVFWISFFLTKVPLAPSFKGKALKFQKFKKLKNSRQKLPLKQPAWLQLYKPFKNLLEGI